MADMTGLELDSSSLQKSRLQFCHYKVPNFNELTVEDRQGTRRDRHGGSRLSPRSKTLAYFFGQYNSQHLFMYFAIHWGDVAFSRRIESVRWGPEVSLQIGDEPMGHAERDLF